MEKSLVEQWIAKIVHDWSEEIAEDVRNRLDYDRAMAKAERLDEEARIRREQEQAEQERKAYEEARERRIRRRNYYA